MLWDRFKVHFDRTINIVTYGNEGRKQQSANASWSGLDCNSYVSLWVSWLNRTIKAGEGTKIGGSILISLPDIDYNDNINNIWVLSLKPADWIFDFLAEEITVLLKHGADKLNYWEGESQSMGEKSYQQEGNLKPGRKPFLRPIDEFFMVMMRLRLGLLQEHLADIFRVFESTVSRIMNS
ncbi:Hypothetical predicted protein [Mytilus galloprovincialis]|uniref:Transposase Helix-turn-helix domain-containing protein n=1 Tax=Mytilus galloprovincialis TaxID=29158 RepID=A0A8B6CTY0_MYTGA|nr:Hypothetical predicted protein [Mytilus galloprovincialis]